MSQAQMVEMVIDSIQVGEPDGVRVLVLKEKHRNRCLAIWIGHAEADAIAVVMQNAKLNRPLTHDVMKSIITSLGVVADYVVIDALKKDEFHAKIALRLNDQRTEVDTRPSDAVALALRVGIPMYAKEAVLAKASITLDEFELVGAETHRSEASDSGVLSAFLGKYEGLHGKAQQVFSPATLYLLKLAQELAKDLRNSTIEPLHLLLAILQSENTRTLDILQALNISAKEAFERLAHIAGLAQMVADAQQMKLGEATRELLTIAIDEAQGLGSQFVEPEHLLLAVLRKSDQATLSALTASTIAYDAVYRALAASYARSLMHYSP